MPYVDPSETPLTEAPTLAEARDVWGLTRLTALVFFLVAIALTAFSLKMGLPALETSALSLLSAVASAAVLYGMPHDRMILRNVFALATGFFTCLTALIFLPWVGLWPSGSGPLLFSFIFVVVGTLARSRACLIISVLALFGLISGSDGLTGLRLDAQVMTLMLFAITLAGSLMTGARAIGGVTLIALMAAVMTLLTSFGVPTVNALAVVAVFALATAIGLLAFYRRGYDAAGISATLSACVFAIATTGYQLFLLNELGSHTFAIVGPMPNFGVVALLLIQGLVLFVGLVQWFSNRASLSDIVLIQSAFALVCTVIVDPSRLARLGIDDPSRLIAAILAVGLIAIAARSLRRAWKNSRPVTAAVSLLMVLFQLSLLLHAALGGFDLALASLLSVSLSAGLAIILYLNPRAEASTAPTPFTEGPSHAK